MDSLKNPVVIPRETVIDHRGFTNDGNGKRGGCVTNSGYPCPQGTLLSIPLIYFIGDLQKCDHEIYNKR